MTRERKHAVVLSGGGGYGAYEVGILKAIMTGRSPTTECEPIEPAVLTGTSVGAFNAAFLASRMGEGGERAVADLEKVWRERIADGPGTCNNGVFRMRFDPLEYMSPSCYLPNPLVPIRHAVEDVAYSATQLFERGLSALQSKRGLLTRVMDELYLGALIDAEPFHDLIRDAIDFEAIHASAAALSIFATSWDTGKPVRFDNTELKNVTSRAVQASASIPGVFPPTNIDGQLYVDGGLSINTPLTPLLKSGADVIHLIFIDPQLGDIPIRRPLSSLAELYRITTILFAAQTRAQVSQIDHINHAVRLLEDAPDDLQDEDVKTLYRSVDRFQERRTSGAAPYRAVDVFIYRPDPAILKGLLGMLDFDSDYVGELIEAGMQDAIDHSPTPDTSRHVRLDASFKNP